MNGAAPTRGRPPRWEAWASMWGRTIFLDTFNTREAALRAGRLFIDCAQTSIDDVEVWVTPQQGVSTE